MSFLSGQNLTKKTKFSAQIFRVGVRKTESFEKKNSYRN